MKTCDKILISVLYYSKDDEKMKKLMKANKKQRQNFENIF
jgi:hypothetical protein